MANNYNEKKAEQWKQRAHKIENPSYLQAIKFYKLQKNFFIEKILKVDKEVADELLKRLDEEIEKELRESDELFNSFDQGFSEVSSQMEEAIGNALIGNPQLLNNLRNSFEERANKKSKDGIISYDTAKSSLEETIKKELNMSKENILDAFFKGSNLSKNNDTAFQDQVYGYARRYLYNKIKTQNSIYTASNHAKQSLKGFYKEVIIAKAFSTILEEYGLEASTLSDIGDERNLSIIYDLFIAKKGVMSGKNNKELFSFISDIEQNINKKGAKEITYDFPDGFGLGLQSKSWATSWDAAEKNLKNINTYALEVAHKEKLMPKDDDAYYWHAGMYNAMNSITDVIGPAQTFFSTGAKTYFTSDLLQKFKDNGYVLAFGMNSVEQKWKITKDIIYFRLHTN